MFKRFIQNKLETYVRNYLNAHPEIRLVAVAGSVGKTTTKNNIATVLSEHYRVRMRNDNHNTEMSAPLAILGIEYPENIRSVFAWLKVFRAARLRINEPADVDIIVQELGADHPGEIPHFSTYLRPDIGVVASVAPEHMEFFKTMEAVAKEELSLANFSKIALINRDNIDGRFADFLTNANIDTYGTTEAAEYRFQIADFELLSGFSGAIEAPELENDFAANIHVIGEHSLRPAMAAVAVSLKLGLTPEQIVAGLAKITPIPGRMNVLRGVENSWIIDDTYNSSPAAAEAALQTLYSLQAPQRIAILGSMNELGNESQSSHEAVGKLCDGGLLAWVVTIGDEAEKYLAPKARSKGCQVKSFKSALDAGAFVHGVMENGAVILAKGSQGGIYAEEAVKIFLHETSEDHQLVRQSEKWLHTKQQFFESLTK